MLSLLATAPFCGIPWAQIDNIPSGTIAAVLGAGHSQGTPHGGCENGPYFLRTASRVLTWGPESPAVFDMQYGGPPLRGAVDLGDLDTGDLTLRQVLQAVMTIVSDLGTEVVPGVIGGDHTVTFAVVEGLIASRGKPFKVVQFDHHLDLQTWDSAITDLGKQRDSIFHTNVMSHVSDRIGRGNLVQIGLNPFTAVEKDTVDMTSGFLGSVGQQVCITAPECYDATALLDLVGKGQDVYLSVDVDVLDHSDMSSTGYPAIAGLRFRELIRLIDLVLADNQLIGFDLVEFAAARTDRSSKTLADAQRAAMIFLHLLCWIRRQADPK